MNGFMLQMKATSYLKAILILTWQFNTVTLAADVSAVAHQPHD
jgi:hypothetical protein